jgi:hypothetical protein
MAMLLNVPYPASLVYKIHSPREKDTESSHPLSTTQGIDVFSVQLPCMFGLQIPQTTKKG